MVAEIILVSPGSQMEDAKQSAQYVARGLSGIGYQVREQISMCDNGRQLQQAVASALKRSHVLVTIGGLGRDTGYLAKTTVAEGLNLPLEQSQEAMQNMQAYCNRTGDPLTQEDGALATLPKGSAPFPGTHGKTPGFVISSAKQHIVMLPLGHNEVIPMFNRYVSPYLGGAASTTVTRTVRTYGISERAVRETLGKILASANPAITVQREQNEVLVRVSAHAGTSQQAAAMCTPALRTIVDKIGDAAYGLDVDSLQSAVISKLHKKELDLAVAEAGSNGMLTRTLTETDGGQDILRYSVAVDENEAKADKLGLDRKKLKKKGGVSEYAAVQMADAVRQKVHTDIGVAICAATDSTYPKKEPPGLVYIAVCDAESVYVKKLVIGDGDASDDLIIDATLSRALNMIRLFVDYLPRRYTGAISLMEALDGKTVTDKDSYDHDDGLDEDEPLEGEKRGLTIGEKIKRFIFILALLVFLGSAAYLANFLYNSYTNKEMAKELSSMFAFGEMEDVEPTGDYPEDYSRRFVGLWNENPDVKAFIAIEDTTVNYPIVQAPDNDYYLRRDFYRKDNQHGVPFFDFRVNVKRPSDNLVVYGHNMTDGQIFGELIKYKELEYYQNHPVVNFHTVYDRGSDNGAYKVFSVFISNAYENQGHVFDYYNFIDAESDAQFAEFLKQLTYRSLINTTVDVEPGDQLITLSTCSYEYQDMRTVVVARKVRDGEDATVDVSGAQLNPNPLYPDVWYNNRGGTKPEGIDSYWTVGPNASSFGGQDDPVSQVSEEPQSAMAVTAASMEPSLDPSSQASPSSQSATEPSSPSSVSQAQSQARSPASSAPSQNAAASQQQAERDARAAEESRRAAEAAERDRSQAAEREASRLASEQEADRLRAEEEAESEASQASSEASSQDGGDTVILGDDVGTLEDDAAQMRAVDKVVEPEPLATTTQSYSTGIELTVLSAGSKKTEDAYDIVAAIVQNEMGPSFHPEALKAQAVAAYTFVAQHNSVGTTPSVHMTETISDNVSAAVNAVLGEAVYYGGKLAFTPYHATSAGATTSSAAVWGGSYPYLTTVDSAVDKNATGYKRDTTMTRQEVEKRISQKLGITPSGDPAGWFEVLSRVEGDYIGDMAVCGETKSAVTGSKITGRIIRETVLNLRSAYFEVRYDAGQELFTFTTYGYGHGVGMSQNGANGYAKQGWDYKRILTHYYPGASVQ